MPKYPIFLELKDRRVVVIGGGTVATRKAQSLLDAGARLVLIAEKIDDTLINLCQNKNAEIIESRYSKNYLSRAVLAIAATNDHQLNRQIYKDCQELEILCNVVDEPQMCDFFVPAVVKRRDLQIAIGTEGACPAYSGHLREKLEQLFTEKHGEFLTELQAFRKHTIESITDLNSRKALLGELAGDESFEYFTEKGPTAWRDRAQKILNQYRSDSKT